MLVNYFCSVANRNSFIFRKRAAVRGKVLCAVAIFFSLLLHSVPPGRGRETSYFFFSMLANEARGKQILGALGCVVEGPARRRSFPLAVVEQFCDDTRLRFGRGLGFPLRPQVRARVRESERDFEYTLSPRHVCFRFWPLHSLFGAGSTSGRQRGADAFHR